MTLREPRYPLALSTDLAGDETTKPREVCRVTGRCGRPAGHRGHHGGWRTDTPEHRLSPRELEVLRTYADRVSVTEVADALGIAPRTVMVHLEHAYRKLGVEGLGYGAPVEAFKVLGWLVVPAA